MLRCVLPLLFAGLFAIPTAWAQTPTIDAVKSAIDNDKFTEADRLIKELLAVDDKNADYYYLQGVVRYKMEDLDGAQSAFEQGIKARGKNPFNHAGLGMILFQQNNDLAAQESLENALAVGKKDITVNFAVATAYLEEGSHSSLKEAEVLLLQAQNKAPELPQSYIALGDYYFAKETPDLAMNQYNQAIEKDPDFVQGYSRVGQMLIEKAQYQEGAQMLAKAMEVDPDYAPAYKHMGELYLKAKDYAKARDNYKKYVELTGNDLIAKQRYASFLFLTEDYQGAIDVLEAMDTTTILKHRLLGMAYLQLDNPEKSTYHMQEYFRIAQEKYTIASDFETLARAQNMTGNAEEADANIKKAIELDPFRVEIYNEMANEAKLEKNHPLEASFRKKYVEAKAKSGQQVKLRDYYAKGVAEYNAKLWEDAKASFGKVVELKEDLTVAHFYLLRIAREEDPDNEQWLVIPHAENIVKFLGEKEMDELKGGERNQLKYSYMYMTLYKYDQQEDGTGDCEAVAPWLEKALVFNPDNEFLHSLKDFCEKGSP